MTQREDHLDTTAEPTQPQPWRPPTWTRIYEFETINPGADGICRTLQISWVRDLSPDHDDALPGWLERNDLVTLSASGELVAVKGDITYHYAAEVDPITLDQAHRFGHLLVALTDQVKGQE